MKVCKDRNEEFALKLVHSLKDSKISEKIPEGTKNCSSSQHFDYKEDTNNFVMISAPFREALTAIAPHNATMDDLVNVAIVFLGVWRGLDSKNRVSLQEIVKKAESFKRVNLNIYPDATISDECKSLLDSISGFEYHIEGRMLYWHIGCMNGSCPWSDVKDAEITGVHPTDKWKLMELLS